MFKAATCNGTQNPPNRTKKGAHRIKERQFGVEPREHFIDVKEETKLGVERIIMLLVLQSWRTQIGGYDM